MIGCATRGHDPRSVEAVAGVLLVIECLPKIKLQVIGCSLLDANASGNKGFRGEEGDDHHVLKIGFEFGGGFTRTALIEKEPCFLNRIFLCLLSGMGEQDKEVAFSKNFFRILIRQKKHSDVLRSYQFGLICRPCCALNERHPLQPCLCVLLLCQ